MYGIWRLDKNDWLREASCRGAVLAFPSRRQAQRRAAAEYGFPSYTEAHRKGWCEVMPLPAAKGGAIR